MKLENKISHEIKKAMKAKDNVRLETLRSIKSGIILIKTKSSEKKDLTENDEINLLQKLVKQRRESANIFKSQKRNDLANSEEVQLKIIQEFLPKQMEDLELEKIINDIILKFNATSMKDMEECGNIKVKPLLVRKKWLMLNGQLLLSTENN